MEKPYDSLLFFFYCQYCKLFSEGLCDASVLLDLPEIIDIEVMEEFDRCIVPNSFYAKRYDHITEKEKTGE